MAVKGDTFSVRLRAGHLIRTPRGCVANVAKIAKKVAEIAKESDCKIRGGALLEKFLHLSSVSLCMCFNPLFGLVSSKVDK